MNPIKLKTCPFCGGNPRIETSREYTEADGSPKTYFTVVCNFCGARAKWCGRKESEASILARPDWWQLPEARTAAENWNTRARAGIVVVERSELFERLDRVQGAVDSFSSLMERLLASK